jgi:hypothetical protein
MPRFKTRSQKLRAFVAGAIVVIGGGSGGFVVIHGGGGSTCTMTSAAASAQGAADCVAYGQTHGTQLSITNPTAAQADVGGANPQLINCSGRSILTYVNAASAAGTHNGWTKTGNGQYPVTLNVTFTGTNNPGVVGFKGTSGCYGQGTGAVDLILNAPLVSSSGRQPTAGFGDDAFKWDRSFGCVNSVGQDDPGLTGTACPGMYIVGIWNAGPLISGNHLDCFQGLGGEGIHIAGARSGDFANGIAGCVGDGGAMYINSAAPSVNMPGQTCNTTTGVNCQNPGQCLNCSMDGQVAVSCIHGIHSQVTSQGGVVNPNLTTFTVTNSIYRQGACGTLPQNGPIEDSGYNYDAGIVSLHADCPNCVFGTSNSVVTNVKGDKWCFSISLPNCPWVGFNPANDNL